MTGLADEDDAALVSRCRHGEAAAWEALVHRYQRLVYAIVRRVGHDEHMAADVFQTVFARLVAHLPRIADPRRLQAWIVTTAKREALLALRRGQRTVSMTRADDAGGEAAEFDVADDAPLPEDALAELQQQDLVRHALDRLDGGADCHCPMAARTSPGGASGSRAARCTRWANSSSDRRLMGFMA